MDTLFTPFMKVLRHRGLLWRTALIDIKGTFAGSLLGTIWLFLGPAMMLAIYALVYGVIFKVRPTYMTVTEYILYVFCGLVPFLSFSASLSAGTMSLSSNRQILLNTVFPAELIPLRSVLVASATMPAGVLILLVGDVLFSRLSPLVVLLPVFMILQIMFTTGLCWVLSLVALLVRDVQHLLYYVIMLLLIVTPIGYTPDMIPSQLSAVMYANPLFYFVNAFQSLIILDQLPALPVLITCVVMSTAVYIAGYAVCSRAKQAFYDLA